MAHPINDADFDAAMRYLRSAWHENEELSGIPEPSEEACEVLVAAVIAAFLAQGVLLAKEG